MNKTSILLATALLASCGGGSNNSKPTPVPATPVPVPQSTVFVPSHPTLEPSNGKYEPRALHHQRLMLKNTPGPAYRRSQLNERREEQLARKACEAHKTCG